MSSVEQRLRVAGFTLPEPVAPVANYVPFVKTGSLVSISGQIPMQDGALACVGKVGDSVSIDDACAAARICALNIIAQAKIAAGGDLDSVRQIVKLGGFVNCVDGFGEQPQVINAASDLMVLAFGDRGRHSRSAVGTNALPLGVPVEIDALIDVGP